MKKQFIIIKQSTVLSNVNHIVFETEDLQRAGTMLDLLKAENNNSTFEYHIFQKVYTPQELAKEIASKW